MPSPFPGMNPFFEQASVWPGFHNKLASELQTLLTEQLPKGYYAELGEEIYLRESSDASTGTVVRPDVWIGTESGGPMSSQSSSGSPQSAIIEFDPQDELRLWNVEVRDEAEQVVTAIELLSPSNKRPGDDRAAYLAKRRKLLKSDAHFVEIDLLRGGPPMPLRTETQSDYRIVVSRVERRPAVDLWTFGLRDPLPQLIVPLRSPAKDVVVSLQTAVDRAYDGAGYARRLYRSGAEAIEPKLGLDDLTWVTSIIG